MARVTVEDCIEKVSNRFELVMLAAHRARELSSGAPLTVHRDNDKNPFVALREVADETIDLGEVEESLVKGLQKHVEVEELEEEEMELLAGDAYTGELMPPMEPATISADDDEGAAPVSPAAAEDGGDDEAAAGAPDFSGQDIVEEE